MVGQFRAAGIGRVVEDSQSQWRFAGFVGSDDHVAVASSSGRTDQQTVVHVDNISQSRGSIDRQLGGNRRTVGIGSFNLQNVTGRIVVYIVIQIVNRVVNVAPEPPDSYGLAVVITCSTGGENSAGKLPVTAASVVIRPEIPAPKGTWMALFPGT